MKKNVILGLAAVTTGLSAGVFFTFSVAINGGLGKLPDASYVAAMQNINQVIQNPVFFLAFFGAAILLPIAAYQRRGGIAPKRFKLLVAASLFYILGPFGITFGGNIPLNEQLDKTPVVSASVEDIAKARADYEKPWLRWQAARTVTGVIALTLVTAACLVPATTKERRTEEAS